MLKSRMIKTNQPPQNPGRFSSIFSKVGASAKPGAVQYDCNWSHFIWQDNKRIHCTKYNYVQHLGFGVGQNSTYLFGNYGIDFQGATPKQLILILEGACRAKKLKGAPTPHQKCVGGLPRDKKISP
jgi:hypothetical protein